MSTVLITGPQHVNAGYFETFYEKRICDAFAAGDSFRVGAAKGVDAFAQELLSKLCEADGETSFARVSIFDKGDKDGRKSAKFQLMNGFATYPERDEAMARGADAAICCLPLFGGGVSGSVIPLLAVLKPGEPTHLDSIRANSEPWWTQEGLDLIWQVYEKMYPSRKKDEP